MSLLNQALKNGIQNETKTHLVSFRLGDVHANILNRLKTALQKKSNKRPSTAQVIELLLEDANLKMEQMTK